MTHLFFLQDLAIVMTVSAVITVLFHALRLPVVLGYILAGFLIGPHTPPFPLITDNHNIQIFSELGIIFLLFSIGLEFSFSRLMRVGLVSFFAATLEIILMIWIGFSLGRMFGWNTMNSLFLGAILSISSTTIIAKVLIDIDKMKERFAQVILGILVIEDILAIVIIALLSGIATTGTITFQESVFAFLRVGTFVLVILVVGLLFIPRLLGYLQRFRTSETMIIAVLGFCFATSYVAGKMGFSVALGAFLTGAVIAETKQARLIIEKIESLRDMFTAVFFVSVGMLIQPALLVQYAVPIALITIVTLGGKIMSCSLATFLTGYNAQTSLKVGLGLAQIGEFSFIIAQLGESSGVTGKFLYPVAVSVSAITTLTTPLLMQNSETITKMLQRWTPKSLAAFFGFYSGWLHRMGGFSVRSEKQKQILSGLRHYSMRFMVYLIVAGVVGYGFFRFHSHFQFFSPVFFWIFLGVVLLPMLLGMAYTLDRILWEVLFLNFIRRPDELNESADVHRVLHNVVRFLTLFFVGFFILGVSSIFAPSPPLALGIGGLVFVAGVMLWSSFRHFQERIEKLIFGIFDREESLTQDRVKTAHDELVKLIHEDYPWEVETEDYLVPLSPSSINRSIGELHLRTQTGASIVAIYRDTLSIPNPGPKTVLLPGDVLLLMGDHDHIRQGLQYLEKLARQKPAAAIPPEKNVPFETRQFVVKAPSLAVGQTIRELNLRGKAQVSILGIKKGSQILNNPESNVVLDENDILILFGTRTQIEQAIGYLQT